MDTVWHITPDGRPALRGTEGFLHASFTPQLAETLRLHFPDAPSVVLLRLDPAALGERLVVEPSRGGELFPHVYGDIEPRDVVARVTLERTPDGAYPLDRLTAVDRPAWLQLEPRPVPRPWGGHRVARRFGWPDGEPAGEWWLASAHPGTETALRHGTLDLADWLEGPGRDRACPAAADFPLLLKFLDADEMLSLQLHPNDEVARRHGLPRGKVEAWHVLDARDDACVYAGTADGVRGTDLLDRIDAGASDGEILGMLHRQPLRPGDTLLLEAGTIHAVAGGIALFEVQQNSDATYRIHDWGRGREVHLAESRDAVVDHAPPKPVRCTPEPGRWTELVRCAAFRLSRARPESTLELRPEGAFGTLTVVAGSGVVRGKGEETEIRAGDTLLVLDPVEIEGRELDLLAVAPGP